MNNSAKITAHKYFLSWSAKKENNKKAELTSIFMEGGNWRKEVLH
jgi:hypothetical protein